MMKLNFTNNDTREYTLNDVFPANQEKFRDLDVEAAMVAMFPRLAGTRDIPFARSQFEAFLAQTRDYYLSRGASGACEIDALYEYLECVHRWNEGLGYPDVDAYFAQNGYLPQLKLRLALGTINSPQLFPFVYAAMGGHCHILDWLCEQGFTPDLPSHAINMAAGHNRANVLEWFAGRGYQFNEKTVFHFPAATAGFDAMKWLFSHGYKPSADTFAMAAGCNHIDVLEYLLSIDCPVDFRAYVNAHMCERTECLKWLENKGFKFPESDKYIKEYQKPRNEQEALSNELQSKK